MRFNRAGVKSNEAPAAKPEPPVHFYQTYYTRYIHTLGATCPLVHVQEEMR